ncbi:MAG: hypothetical protein KDC00_00330, partial [Flavobacteriales bacterium]|nr:hypothetical protein [Flavobacteriales bacterium]
MELITGATGIVGIHLL